MASPVSLKVTLNGEHRRASLQEVSMKEVERIISTVHGMEKNEYVLSYVDGRAIRLLFPLMSNWKSV